MMHRHLQSSLLRILGALALGAASLLPVRPASACLQGAAITEEFLNAAYGVHVDDGRDASRPSSQSWTSHELSLLNELFAALPPAVVQRMSHVRILRRSSDLDPQGNPDRSRFGLYLNCDLNFAPDCRGLAASIYIFDRAHSRFDFPADSDGDLQFKGTVLHELTHALQNFPEQGATSAQSGNETQDHDSDALLRGCIAATRTWTVADGSRYCGDPGGWIQVGDEWKMAPAPGSEPPTTYAAIEPTEDMAESVMLYVFDPQRLKNSSAARYDFVRDRIFDGVQYVNGSP